jgi:hypothetical protein
VVQTPADRFRDDLKAHVESLMKATESTTCDFIDQVKQSESVTDGLIEGTTGDQQREDHSEGNSETNEYHISVLQHMQRKSTTEEEQGNDLEARRSHFTTSEHMQGGRSTLYGKQKTGAASASFTRSSLLLTQPSRISSEQGQLVLFSNQNQLLKSGEISILPQQLVYYIAMILVETLRIPDDIDLGQQNDSSEPEAGPPAEDGPRSEKRSSAREHHTAETLPQVYGLQGHRDFLDSLDGRDDSHGHRTILREPGGYRQRTPSPPSRESWREIWQEHVPIRYETSSDEDELLSTDHEDELELSNDDLDKYKPQPSPSSLPFRSTKPSERDGYDPAQRRKTPSPDKVATQKRSVLEAERTRRPHRTQREDWMSSDQKVRNGLRKEHFPKVPELPYLDDVELDSKSLKQVTSALDFVAKSKTQPLSTIDIQPPWHKRQATRMDTERAGIPKVKFLADWDPDEEPIVLLGCAFDAYRLGCRIYCFTINKYGRTSPIGDLASKFWYQIIQLAGKIKLTTELRSKAAHGLAQSVATEVLKNGNHLWTRLQSLMKECKDWLPISTVMEPSGVFPISVQSQIIRTVFSPNRELLYTKKLMADMHGWFMQVNSNLKPFTRTAAAGIKISTSKRFELDDVT